MRGHSGRIVIETSIDLKNAIHAAVAAEGMTLKQWFERSAAEYCDRQRQPEFELPKVQRNPHDRTVS